MTNSKTFDLLVTTTEGFINFKVLTRFDQDYWEDDIFGKEDKERVKYTACDIKTKSKKKH